LVTITVAVDLYGESQRSTPLDEVVCVELKLRLRTMIAQLHMKYYSTRPDVLLSPNLPSRNSSFRRMVVLTAEIPAGEESDPMHDLQVIECVPFSDFSLHIFKIFALKYH
uniref:HORMA domain-containing protein n=1 Tax=Angiostrongylus cantonensis TaxID=6313 RepID=A0A0K0D650_ANGCA